MTERGRAAGAIGAKCENPARAMSKRLRKVLKIGLVSPVAAVLLTAAGGGFWLHRQLQPQDLTAADRDGRRDDVRGRRPRRRWSSSRR